MKTPETAIHLNSAMGHKLAQISADKKVESGSDPEYRIWPVSFLSFLCAFICSLIRRAAFVTALKLTTKTSPILYLSAVSSIRTGAGIKESEWGQKQNSEDRRKYKI
jgi:hypothetical protein